MIKNLIHLQFKCWFFIHVSSSFFRFCDLIFEYANPLKTCTNVM